MRGENGAKVGRRSAGPLNYRVRFAAAEEAELREMAARNSCSVPALIRVIVHAGLVEHRTGGRLVIDLGSVEIE